MEDFLEELYEKISDDCSSFNKSELLFQIIQIKSLNPKEKNYCQSLHVDSKKFIKNYLNSIDDRDYGYDVIDLDKIESIIKFNNNNDERFSLASYSKRLINNLEYEELSKKFKKRYERLKTNYLLNNNDNYLKKLVKIIAHLSSYNILSMLISIFIIFIISTIVFLPDLDGSSENFQLTYDIYNKNFYFNHFLNFLAAGTGIEDSFKISPITAFGVFLLVFFKLLYVLILINYIYRKILEIIFYGK